MGAKGVVRGVLATAVWLAVSGVAHATPLDFLEATTAAGGGQLQSPRLAPTGGLAMLVVFARFADGAQTGPPAFAEQLFDPERPGSVRHYFDAMSLGQLAVSGTVLPLRYAGRRPAHTYRARSPRELGEYGQLVIEILDQVDRDVDFSRFDNDGPDGVPGSGDDDGVVDYLFLVVQDAPANFLRGKATGVVGLGFALDDQPMGYVTQDLDRKGRRVRVVPDRAHGAVLVERPLMSHIVGAMAHEFGHSLGLADLYDTSFQGDPDQDVADDSAGIGRWGLMGWGADGWRGGDGPNALSAWSREQLGWIGRDNDRLVVIEADTTVALADLEQGGRIYRVGLGAEAATATYVHETYLLLEFRTRIGSYYNRHQPGEGLLVWHVRPRAQGNTREEFKLVDLVCADGLRTSPRAPRPGDDLDHWSHDEEARIVSGGNLGDATDPFDGVIHTRLVPDGSPSSRLLGPASTGVVLENLRRVGDRATVDVRMPRWSGLIDRPVVWKGVVRIDADLTVAPGGKLTILEGTEVLLAGTDALHSGLDHARCEIAIHGRLAMLKAVPLRPGQWYLPSEARPPSPPVVFRAEEEGDDWYGMVVSAPGRNLSVLPGSYVLQDARYGLVLPGAGGAEGVRMSGFGVAHTASTDIELRVDVSSGEEFRLVVEVADWSLSAYDDVRLFLFWDTPLLTARSGLANRSVASESFSLIPGQRREVWLPTLHLAPEARPGEPMDLQVYVHTSSRIWVERLRLEVAVADEVPTVVREADGLPHRFSAGPGYPNPFNSRVVIPLLLPTDGPGRLTVAVYDVAGQRVRRLYSGVLAPGSHELIWDGRDDAGRPAASGAYRCLVSRGIEKTGFGLTLLR